MFRFQILGLLRSRKPFHGYALMKEYNERTGRSYGAGYFYRLLSELHAAQLIRDSPTPPGMDRRRALYEITDRGMDAFDSWFCNVGTKNASNPRDQLGRAIFFPEVEPELRENVLTQWRRVLTTNAKSLQDQLDAMGSKARSRGRVRPLLIHRELVRIRADLDFLDELERKMPPSGNAPRKGSPAAPSTSTTAAN